MIDWERCKEDFRWDGSLRDIYVTPATVDDWRALYPRLCDYPGAEYSAGGVVKEAPNTVEQAFASRSSGIPIFRIQVGAMVVVFHFFSEDQIECDIDPREISSQSDLDVLVGFMRWLGDAVRKPVLLTPENRREHPIITYVPDRKEFLYHEVVP
jgi:hypothetical protein